MLTKPSVLCPVDFSEQSRDALRWASAITLHRGDMLVYKGRELAHWRERFDGNYWIQAFFHYVDANGALASYKFDRRRGIGLPRE